MINRKLVWVTLWVLLLSVLSFPGRVLAGPYSWELVGNTFDPLSDTPDKKNSFEQTLTPDSQSWNGVARVFARADSNVGPAENNSATENWNIALRLNGPMGGSIKVRAGILDNGSVGTLKSYAIQNPIPGFTSDSATASVSSTSLTVALLAPPGHYPFSTALPGISAPDVENGDGEYVYVLGVSNLLPLFTMYVGDTLTFSGSLTGRASTECPTANTCLQAFAESDFWTTPGYGFHFGASLVPEPSPFVLLTFGLCAVGLAVRRSRR